MLCRVFFRGARKIFESRTLESFTSCNQRSLYTKVCLQNTRLPSATSALGYTLGTSTSRRLENLLRTSFFHCFKFWRCVPEEDVLTQDQLDSWEDVEGVVYDQGLSYVPKIIRIELTSHFGIEKLSRACYKKFLAVAATNTFPLLKRLGRDCLCLSIGRTSYDSIFVKPAGRILRELMRALRHRED